MLYRKLANAWMISAVAAAVAVAQPERDDIGKYFHSDDTFHAEFVARLEPGSPAIQKRGAGLVSKDGLFKRHLVNPEGRTYAGYDLRFEPLAGGRVRLRFVELSIEPAEMSKIFPEVRDWTRLARPADAPSTLEAQSGEAVTVVLYFNPSTGQKVTDSIKVRQWNARNDR